MMTTAKKPSIVFAHGLWADGSCFSKLIPALHAEGHQVMASQHGCWRRTSLRRSIKHAVLAVASEVYV
jgi:hypothetical protein